ncbi:MAG: adenosylmethionine decarboxylase [Phycisphaerae bacterium]|nr:adenosylmethionine decarboxylase [Phycisphaerae bacterium]
MEAESTHCILELYDCPSHLLDDKAFVTNALREAVEHGLATLLHEVSHHFHPQGVTALALISESHLSIHTWPEYGYAAADVFTCGETAQPEKACVHLVRVFQAGRHSLTKLTRGLEAKRTL